MRFSERSVCLAVSLLGIGLLLTFSSTVHAQNSLGRWKVNPAKSSYDPGPPPKSDDRVYEAWEGDGLKVTINRMQADGTHTAVGYAAHYDGKDYKYTGSATTNAISIKRIDANTTEAVLKKDGKTLRTVTTVISGGGKVLTQTTVGGIGPDGQKLNKNVVVFDRQ